MTDLWNTRYAREDYTYGTAPNVYFAEHLLRYRPHGSILLPADGEGRNGVFAATHGLEVNSFDLSEEGRNKAMKLAAREGVSINYQVGDFNHLGYRAGSFDVLALVYAHFPAESKEEYNRTLATYLKTGGLVIFEAFGSRHLSYREANPAVGGPGDATMLFSTDEIRRTFPHFEVLHLAEEEVTLDEGDFHQGMGSVVRFVGRKL